MRPPSEILDVLDQAQAVIDNLHEDLFDLRSLMWEVIDDVLSSAELALTARFPRDPSTSDHDAAMAALDEVRDHLANNYGNE